MLPPPALVLAVVLAAALGSFSPAWAEELQTRLAAGEVITFCHQVDGSSLHRAQAQGVVEAPPAQVWQVVTGVNHFQHFMPNTLKSRAVAPELVPAIVRRQPLKAKEVETLLGPAPVDTAGCRVPGQKYIVYLYSLLDFPWPVANRWYIIKISQDETQADRGRYTSSWSMECGNMKENRGEWLLEPFGNDNTQVTYRLFTDPGGRLPDFLVKRGTSVCLPQIISSVRKRVAALRPY